MEDPPKVGNSGEGKYLNLESIVEGWLTKYELKALPLTRTSKPDTADALLLQSEPASTWFPRARSAGGAVSGLLLRMGSWEATHRVSQELTTADGSYWHAIAHRMEPDASNALYWFRRVGLHSVLPALHDGAAELLQRVGPKHWKLQANWDHSLFVEWCDEARQAPGTVSETAALAIQDLEWNLLFSFCRNGGR